MSRFKVNRGIFIALAAIICSLNLPASGQNSASGTTSPSGIYQRHQGTAAPLTGSSNAQMHPLTGTSIWGTQKNKQNENIQELKESPDLPNLPTYSGKSKFAHGCVQTSENGWTTYQLFYVVKEPMQDVRDWYQNTFNSYQWKTINSSLQSLNAKNGDGTSCRVIVNSSTEPGYKTRLTVFYNQAPSQ